MENMLVGAGIVFMAGALIGGGLSAFGVTLPVFSSIRRQVLLFLLGAVLLAIGAYPRFFAPGPGEPQGNSRDADQGNVQDAAQTNTGGAVETNTGTAETNTVVSLDPTMGPLEEGVNRQGYDFDKFGIAAANAEDCADICRLDRRCVAMTYVISLRRCWPKSKVPPAKPGPDHISAVKDGY